MIIAAASSAAGTALGLELTTAGTAAEVVVTGITGGYYASLAAGSVEMVVRKIIRVIK